MGNSVQTIINEDYFKQKLIAVPNRTYLIDKKKTDEILQRINDCHHVDEEYKINLTNTLSFILENTIL